MTDRPRTPVTSLRSKVTTTLVVALIGPLLGLAAGIAVWGPRHATQSAKDDAAHVARSAAVALQARCAAVGEAATSAARQAASYAMSYGSLQEVAARAVSRATAVARPEVAIAVFDPNWKLLHSAGSPAGRRPAQAGGYGASCAEGLPGGNMRVAGLAERREVWITTDGRKELVGFVVLWEPLDTAALRGLRVGLGAKGELSVLGTGDRVLATSATPAAQDQLTEVAGLAATEKYATTGAVAGVGYYAYPAVTGVPFRVLATSPVAGRGVLWVVALVALSLGLLALLPIRALADRLSEPVAEELEITTGELQVSRVALADTLASFGAVLQHTHNLDKMLDTVAAACLHGTGAVAGVVLLTEEGDDAVPGRPSMLQTRGTAVTVAPTARAAVGVLPEFAERYLRALAPGVPAEPLFARLPAAGPVMAVPVRTGGRLIGILALARGQGAVAFDALALPLLRSLADNAGTAIANVRLHEEVRRLSVTDPLTGVGNVRHLTTTLSREVAGATRFDRPLTVLMLDLDHFKLVNDTLGHQFGDVVLREFAHRVMTCVREVDTVARCGGEEFAVVLPNTDVDGGCRAAERVLRVVRDEPFRHGDLWQAVTVSIGVASFPGHGRSATEVLHAADEALYAAKREGRDRWEVAAISPSATAVSQAG